MNVLIICARRFNGHELYTVLDVLDKHGHEWNIVSTDVVIQDMDTDEPFRIATDQGWYIYEPVGLIVVEGDKRDTELLWSESRVQRAVRAFYGPVPMAAFGLAVPALGPNIDSISVSVFPTFDAREAVTKLGATLTGATITIHHNVVTGEHSQTAWGVTEAFCKMLETHERSSIPVRIDTEFKPDGRKPRPVDLIDKIKRMREAKNEQPDN